MSEARRQRPGGRDRAAGGDRLRLLSAWAWRGTSCRNQQPGRTRGAWSSSSGLRVVDQQKLAQPRPPLLVCPHHRPFGHELEQRTVPTTASGVVHLPGPGIVTRLLPLRCSPRRTTIDEAPGQGDGPGRNARYCYLCCGRTCCWTAPTAVGRERARRRRVARGCEPAHRGRRRWCRRRGGGRQGAAARLRAGLGGRSER